MSPLVLDCACFLVRPFVSCTGLCMQCPLDITQAQYVCVHRTQLETLWYYASDPFSLQSMVTGHKSIKGLDLKRSDVREAPARCCTWTSTRRSTQWVPARPKQGLGVPTDRIPCYKTENGGSVPLRTYVWPYYCFLRPRWKWLKGKIWNLFAFNFILCWHSCYLRIERVLVLHSALSSKILAALFCEVSTFDTVYSLHSPSCQ
jgi:hypothetical protein